MDRFVDGELWVERGWVRVLRILYEEDVFVNLSRATVPQEISSQEYEEFITLSDTSPLLTQTELSENQAVKELHHLHDEGLVHHMRPFEETDVVVYRLTEQGFKVAHELQRTAREDEWRAVGRRTNTVLTVATVFLAITAVVQAVLAYLEIEPPTSTWPVIFGGILLVLITLAGIARGLPRRSSFWDLAE